MERVIFQKLEYRKDEIMGNFIVDELNDRGTKYFLIRREEDRKICILPTKYLKHKMRSKRSPNTVKGIARSLVYFMRYLSSHKMELEDLFGLPYLRQMEIFQGFLHYLKSRNHVYEQKSGKIENNTCNLYLRNVFGFYQYLEMLEDQFGTLSALEKREVSYTNKVGNRRTRIVRRFEGYLKEYEVKEIGTDREDLIKLLEACDNSRDQVLLLFLAETGVRPGELCGIKQIDFDWSKQRVYVCSRTHQENEARAKNEEQRWATISNESLLFLCRYVQEYKDILIRSEYLFVTLTGKRKGKALKTTAVSAMMRRLKAKTGITVTGRKLRHYFATERWKGGWGIETISRALGHRNLDVTRRYIDMDQEVLAEATENIFQSNEIYAMIAEKLL